MFIFKNLSWPSETLSRAAVSRINIKKLVKTSEYIVNFKYSKFVIIANVYLSS